MKLAMSDAGSDPFSLCGKTVLQMGGTGLLGLSLVSSLSRAGATLVVASRTPHLLGPIAERERSQGRAIETEEVDITSEASLARLRDSVLARHRKIDGLVFNAVTRPMRGMSDELARWAESMATNATGFFATVRTVGDAMAAGGSIVNIASQMGMIGMNPYLYDNPAGYPPPDYFFHKGGMINLTRYLAAHYAPRIRVNVVSPGGIFNPDKPQPEGFLKRYAQTTMLGRMADAKEIGGAVVYLLSDASTYVTGINLPVDGGYTAK